MSYRLFLILFLLPCSCFAQFQKFASELLFNRYSTDEGLSQSSVNVILKDSKGFTWIGTDDGLNRFDGNQFRIYKRKPGDSTTISGNTVEALWEDSLSRVWVGTSEGLSIYDRHFEKFKSYAVEGQEFYPCFELKEDPVNKRVWIAAGVNGLYYYDPQYDMVKSLSHEDLKGLNVLKLEIIGNILYIGTLDRGLFSLDLKSDEVKTVPIGKETLPHAIRALLRDSSSLWIGTEGAGLKKIDTATGKLEVISSEKGKLSDDKIWSLARSADLLWIGTDGGGLNVLNTRTGAVSVHTHSYYNPRSISSNTIRCITKDRIGDLWFGTFNGGISFLPSFNIKFHSFRNEPERPHSLPHNSILSFHEISDGTVLIGTDGRGLASLKNGKFSTYSFPPKTKSPRVILTIHEDTRSNIWLGTYQEGLYKIQPDKTIRRFVHDPRDSSSISSNIVWDIAEDDEGNLWIATEVGLNRLRTDETEFSNYRNKAEDDPAGLFTPEFTQSVIVGSASTLWVGYFGSLVGCYLPTGRITSYASGTGRNEIPNKQVLSLHVDQRDKNVIWFSSFGAGLMRFHVMDKEFKLFTEEDGLPGNQIFAIQTDRKGIVWFTTNKGIVRFHPGEKSFYVFEKSFGVNTAPYKDNSSGQTSSGYLMFGGTNGFTAFWPGDINFQKNSLDVVFTGFRLFNEEVPIDNSILKKSITETAGIRIPYDRAKFMNLEFSVPNFLSPSMVQYQYMLEGFEDSWHTVENKNISFTNLLPGKYTLRVKAGFPSGIWGDEKQLSITVIAPWWMAWYSRIGMLLLVVGLAFGYYRYRTYSLNKRKAELERIVAEQYQEIHDKNLELAQRNEDLSAHNRELLTNRETISKQNKMLFDAQVQLREINLSLEKLVQQRTEKLNETISQLNKTIKELDAFLYSASHDLVSPLKSILGLVNLAKMENRNIRIQSYFNHIEMSVSKLEAIIQTLMQHSFNTKAELKLEPVDLCALVDETIGELKFIPETEKIRFKYSLNDAKIVTDSHRLKIILSNLLGNAVKYHDGHKKENVVEVEFNKTGDVWTLAVVDNGIGIEKDRLDRVFELFYRATESAKGSGLGLYIVKDTIDRLGGSISVDSEIGKWTRFTLSFPVNNISMLN
jgi:signal transduction histidine kinase/ligand-binding sensor domain-containing protein